MENKPKLLHSKELSHSLTDIVDQDIQQEAELLKDLIQDILYSNEKIKRSHFELVEDTKAKLQHLNREISRIQTVLEKNDDMLQNERFEALKELKTMYYEQLSLVRLHDLKEHFKNPIEKVLDDLKESTLRAYQTHINPKAHLFLDVLQQMLDFYVHKMRRFEDETNLFYEANQIDVDHLDDRFKLVFESFDHDMKQFFDHLDETLKQLLLNEDESSIILQFTDEKKTLENYLNKAKEPIDTLTGQWLGDIENYQKRRQDDRDKLFNTLSKGKEEALKKEKKSTDVLKHRMQLIKEQVVNAQLTDKQQFKLLKTYDGLMKKFHQSVEGKIELAIQKRLKGKFEALEKAKYDRTFKYYHQLYDIKEKIALKEVNSRISLLTTLIQDRDQKINVTLKHTRQIESAYKTHLKNMRNFILSLSELEFVLKSKMFDTYKDMQILHYQWGQELDKVKAIIQQQELQILKTLHENHYELKLFHKELEYKSYEQVQKLKHVQALNVITKARLNAQSEAVFTMMEDKERLMNDQIEAENYIMIAQREHDIQVLKAQSMYDHERALNKAKTERLDAGVHINKSLLQAALKRQVKFAQQQLNFIEKEYDVRVEHIEYTYQQEVNYLEAKLKALLKPYQQKETELKADWENDQEIAPKFNPMIHHNKQKKRLEQDLAQLNERYIAKLEKLEQDKHNNAELQRYVSLISQADAIKKQALEDASKLKETDAKAFEDLLSDSQLRLSQFEQLSGAPEELTYEGEDLESLANQRLKERIKSAEDYLENLIAKPKEKLDSILAELDRLTPQPSQSILDNIQAQEQEHLSVNEARVQNLQDEYESQLQSLLKEQDAAITEIQHHIAVLSKRIDATEQSEVALEAKLVQQQQKLQEDQKIKQKSIESRFASYAQEVTATFENLRAEYQTVNEKNLLIRESFLKRKDRIITETSERIQQEKIKKVKDLKAYKNPHW